MLQKVPSRSEQAALFARNFFKHPKMLGSLIPSSRFLIRELLGQVDWKRAKVLVEYGPGVGTITTEILRRMRPDAKLFVLETNQDFVRFLRSSVRDSRLHIVNGSAAEVDRVLEEHGHAHADYLFSGIPFSTIPDPIRQEILQKTQQVLHPGGAFLVYQFSRAVQPHLKRIFGEVEQDFEPLNIPPALLYYCRK